MASAGTAGISRPSPDTMRNDANISGSSSRLGLLITARTGRRRVLGSSAGATYDSLALNTRPGQANTVTSTGASSFILGASDSRTLATSHTVDRSPTVYTGSVAPALMY